MSELFYPAIACLTPTCDRPAFLERSIRCFLGQSEAKQRFQVILDTGTVCIEPSRLAQGDFYIRSAASDGKNRKSVGSLRNEALHCLRTYGARFNLIAHFDDDDWSAPGRLKTQVAHLQQTGKLVTGFNDMLFMDLVNDRVMFYRHEDDTYALGTSLLYRREAWEQHPFPDMTPEDNRWRLDVGLSNCHSISSLRPDGTPMMIQVIHGKNGAAQVVFPSKRWSEATPEQDRMVREILKNA